MSAVVNLRREPKLREAFEYAHVVNNTVLGACAEGRFDEVRVGVSSLLCARKV